MRDGISFSRFKMVAAAILDFDYYAFSDIKEML